MTAAQQTSNMNPVRPTSGFTLLELLVALSVFTVMSAMAYGGLSSLLNTRETVVRKGETLTRLQMTFNRLATDVEQALARRGTDGMGSERPALAGGEGFIYFLEFTRGGRSNPQNRPRSALQHIAYSLEDETLKRHSWHYPDHLAGEEPLTTTLLKEVQDVEIRFLSSSRSWQPFWPPDVREGVSIKLPKAVEITIEKNGWGRIRRLFEVIDGS